MNERHIAAAQAVEKCLNGIGTASEISWKMGYRKNSGRLAVTATLRSMERQELVGRIAPRDQWGHANLFLTTKGKKELIDQAQVVTSIVTLDNIEKN